MDSLFFLPSLILTFAVFRDLFEWIEIEPLHFWHSLLFMDQVCLLWFLLLINFAPNNILIAFCVLVCLCVSLYHTHTKRQNNTNKTKKEKKNERMTFEIFPVLDYWDLCWITEFNRMLLSFGPSYQLHLPQHTRNQPPYKNKKKRTHAFEHIQKVNK